MANKKESENSGCSGKEVADILVKTATTGAGIGLTLGGPGGGIIGTIIGTFYGFVIIAGSEE
jgi:hypothetical protein